MYLELLDEKQNKNKAKKIPHDHVKKYKKKIERMLDLHG